MICGKRFFFGWCLIASSIVSVILIKILHSVANLEPHQFMNASIVALVGPLAVVILLTHIKIRKLEKDKNFYEKNKN